MSWDRPTTTIPGVRNVDVSEFYASMKPPENISEKQLCNFLLLPPEECYIFCCLLRIRVVRVIDNGHFCDTFQDDDFSCSAENALKIEE